MEENIITAHVKVTGRVQGVGFRYWTMKEAGERNLSGWVRNRRDGSVEALFIGTDEVVNDMIKACFRGPMFAKVISVTPVSIPDAPMPPLKQGVFTSQATV